MQEIGAFDAKTRLAEILRQVEDGESFLITRRGKPVARLVPPDETATKDYSALLARMQQRRAALPELHADEINSGRNPGPHS